MTFKKNLWLLFLGLSATIAYANENEESPPLPPTETSQFKPAQALKSENLNGAHDFQIDFLGSFNVNSGAFSNAITSNNVSINSSETVHGNSLGAGIVPVFFLNDSLSIETGLYYDPRILTDSGITATFQTLEFAPIVRYYIVPRHFSVGLGPYLSYGVGSVSFTDNYSNITTSAGYDVTKYNPFEFGGVASLAYKFPFTPIWSLVADARYLLAITKTTNSTSVGDASVGFSQFEAMVGLSLGL